MVKIVFDVRVYADKDELRAATEAYLKGTHEEFYNTFERTSWLSFFETKISHEVGIFLCYNLVMYIYDKYANIKFSLDNETVSVNTRCFGVKG